MLPVFKKIIYSIPLAFVIIGTISAQSSSTTSSSNSSPVKGWISAYTNREESSPSWEIIKSKDDSISHYIFHLLKTDAHGSEFNLCYTKKITFSNGSITVGFKADSGHEDQGGGIAWRVKDKNNYYIARYNPLEENLCLYYVKNGHRRLLKGATVTLNKGHWHSMKIVQENNHFTAYLDSKKILQGEDSTFTNAGGIGLWTKADALTSFKDLKIKREK